MVASLMHDGADLEVFVVLIGVDGTDSRFKVFFQKHPLPPTLGTDTPVPASDLSGVVFTATSQEETDVPLEPAAWVVVKVQPAGGLPLGERLAALDLEFVEARSVDGRGEVLGGWRELVQPVFGQGV